MLDADELAAMRAEVLFSFPDTAMLYRGGYGTDDLQGGAADKPVFVAAYACRVMSQVKRAPIEVMASGAVKQDPSGSMQTVTRYAVMLPFDSDVRPGDILIVGSRTYKVMDSGLPTDNAARETQCEVIT